MWLVLSFAKVWRGGGMLALLDVVVALLGSSLFLKKDEIRDLSFERTDLDPFLGL